MNVDKMRHQLDRTAQEPDLSEQERWLAAMTPQHRAFHERPNVPGVKWGVDLPCYECVKGWIRDTPITRGLDG